MVNVIDYFKVNIWFKSEYQTPGDLSHLYLKCWDDPKRKDGFFILKHDDRNMTYINEDEVKRIVVEPVIKEAN